MNGRIYIPNLWSLYKSGHNIYQGLVDQQKFIAQETYKNLHETFELLQKHPSFFSLLLSQSNDAYCSSTLDWLIQAPLFYKAPLEFWKRNSPLVSPMAHLLEVGVLYSGRIDPVVSSLAHYGSKIGGGYASGALLGPYGVALFAGYHLVESAEKHEQTVKAKQGAGLQFHAGLISYEEYSRQVGAEKIHAAMLIANLALLSLPPIHHWIARSGLPGFTRSAVGSGIFIGISSALIGNGVQMMVDPNLKHHFINDYLSKSRKAHGWIDPKVYFYDEILPWIVFNVVRSALEGGIEGYSIGKGVQGTVFMPHPESAPVSEKYSPTEIALAEKSLARVQEGILQDLRNPKTQRVIEASVQRVLDEWTQTLSYAGQKNIKTSGGPIQFNQVGQNASPKSPVAYRALRSEFRAQMDPPLVKDSALVDLVERSYREGSVLGNGSTAEAVRYERLTGGLVGGRSHTQKAIDTLGELDSWLRNHPQGTRSDLYAVELLRADLIDALWGKLKRQDVLRLLHSADDFIALNEGNPSLSEETVQRVQGYRRELTKVLPSY